jgi:hypothetical protein
MPEKRRVAGDTMVRGADHRPDPMPGTMLPAALLLLAAVAVMAIGQGGFYDVDRTVAELLLLIGAAWLWRRGQKTGRSPTGFLRPVGPLVAGLGALAAAAVVSGGVGGRSQGVPATLLVLAALAAAAVVGAAQARTDRHLLAGGAIAVGVVVAATGWVGVVWRLSPLAHPDGGLWRAATTITYANAAAALLSLLALWALARLAGATFEPGSPRTVRLSRAATGGLLLGLAATASRAGLAAFVVGLAVLAYLIGPARIARSAWPAAAAAVVGFAGLMPGMSTTGPARPTLAILGLAAGSAIVLIPWPARWVGSDPDGDRPRNGRSRPYVGLAAALLVAAGIAVATVGPAHINGWAGRVSVSSPDRSSATTAALRLWADHRAVGVGPGRTILIWSDHGRMVFDRFVHDEYLQVAVEDGVVGLAVLIYGVVRTLRAGWRTDRRRRQFGGIDHLRAGPIAGLVAFAVHSGFDFVWHVPVVPLVAALGIGLASPLPGIEKQHRADRSREEIVSAS